MKDNANNMKNVNVLLEDASMLESVKKNNDYFISGTFATANKKNKNGRVYNDTIWTEAVNKFSESIGTQRALVELDHPVGRFEVDPFKAVGKITKLTFNGSLVEGTIKILNNNSPETNHLKALIDEGITLGVSSRGSGALDESNNVVTYDLSTFDIVADPSDYNANALVRVNEEVQKANFVQCKEGCIMPLSEAKEKEMKKEQKELSESEILENELAFDETRQDVKDIIDNLNEDELNDIVDMVCSYVLNEQEQEQQEQEQQVQESDASDASTRESDSELAKNIISILKSY